MHSLSSNETLPEGTERILSALIDDTIRHLEVSPEQLDTIVHEARKNFKKYRAILKLFRYHLGKNRYKKENYFFRDMGRKLSPARDAEVVIETLNKLQNRYDLLGDEDYKLLKNKLEQKSYHIKLYGLKTKGVPDSILRELISYKKNRLEWVKNIPHSFHPLSEGLRHIYKKGIKQAHKAFDKGEASRFHEWRKEAKYLRYQLDFLNPLWPAYLEAAENELHTLTDLLGLDHDLEVFKTHLKQADNSNFVISNVASFYEQITTWQDELRQQALTQKKLLYNENPEQFIHRMQAYWSATYSG